MEMMNCRTAVAKVLPLAWPILLLSGPEQLSESGPAAAIQVASICSGRLSFGWTSQPAEWHELEKASQGLWDEVSALLVRYEVWVYLMDWHYPRYKRHSYSHRRGQILGLGDVR